MEEDKENLPKLNLEQEQKKHKKTKQNEQCKS